MDVFKPQKHLFEVCHLTRGVCLANPSIDRVADHLYELHLFIYMA